MVSGVTEEHTASVLISRQYLPVNYIKHVSDLTLSHVKPEVMILNAM